MIGIDPGCEAFRTASGARRPGIEAARPEDLAGVLSVAGAPAP